MIVLQAEAVSKRYGGTVALDSVDFSVHSHAVNVLIGENGAGKSTLMKILAGVEQPSAGRLLLDGKPVKFASVRDAVALGIGIVHQELNLCPNLSVTENIFLARDMTTAGGSIDRATERAIAQELLAKLEHAIDPDALAGDLRVGEQQIVEIAKALVEDTRVLIMDEPTSALSIAEVEALFRVIGELKKSGVAIIYISHRLEELIRIGDHVTILRDGKLQATAPIAETSVPWMIDQMLGTEGRIERHKSTKSETGKTVLAVRDISLPRPGSGFAVDHVSAEFHAGEITAIYGLLGSGRTELLESICGARADVEGSVDLDGEEVSRISIAERVRRGLLLVPEDRQAAAQFANLGVDGNLGLVALGRFVHSGIISVREETAEVVKMISRLGIKTPAAVAPISTLSGGNQQKVVIGRCLMAGPKVILLDEPSRGIDVGARAEVFETMRAIAVDGLAVIFSTSDMTEAQTVADRILVMAGGRITADMSPSEANEEALVQASNNMN